MKSKITLLVAALAATSSLQAGDSADAITHPPVHDPSSYLWDAHRPDSHAPIGVMGDHTHEAGEFMLSYRWMYMSMDGHRAGTDKLSSQQVYDRGFGVAAEEMEMQMHMIGAMFAPSDWLTLMVMTNYIEKDMTMSADPHAHGHGSGHGGGHTGTFGHSSSGWGDTSVGALVKIFDNAGQRAHLNLMFTLPTAEVDKKDGGAFLPYGMQLGSGTWDFKPGITYLGQAGNLSWGAQVGGTIRLESENDSGFAYGDGVNFTPWLAYRLTDNLSVSGRVNYIWEDDLKGHYNGPHDHVAPTQFQENYGGHTLEGGVGLNWYFNKGFLKGHRLATEVLVPMYQDLNGVGMNRDYSVVVGWQVAF